MSAFIVSMSHISAIVGWYVNNERRDVHGDGKWKDAPTMNKEIQRLGQLLLDENYKSVNWRYNEGNEPPRFVMNRDYLNKPVSLGQLSMAIRCLDYQSCEHDGWQTSEAFKFLQEVKEALIRSPELPGAATAVWGIDDGVRV